MVGILPTSLANSIFGAWLIASSLTCMSTGIAYAQFFKYFGARNTDRPHIRYVMILLVFITTLHLIWSIHVPYYYLVLEYGNPRSASRIIWSWSVNSCLIELTDLIIRFLFARRVWLLSQGNKWVTILACALSVATFAVLTAIAILLHPVQDLASIVDKSAGGIYTILRHMIWLSFALNLAAEMVLTSALCYYLYKSKTGFRKTNTLIYTLIVYTIHTGLIIFIGSTIATITYLVGPPANYVDIFYFLESSLYVNAYLAGVSASYKIRNSAGSEVVSVHLSQMHPYEFGSSTVTDQEKTTSTRPDGGIQVAVDQRIEVEEK